MFINTNKGKKNNTMKVEDMHIKTSQIRQQGGCCGVAQLWRSNIYYQFFSVIMRFWRE